jgi:dUTP pyrophosphatase
VGEERAPRALYVKKLVPEAKLPTRGSDGAIGLDLCAVKSHVIEPGARCVVTTGISAAIPPGYYGRVAPRSGLAFKHGLDVLAGVIDDDYRGDISVMLINHGDRSVVISQYDRVGQLIIERADKFAPVEITDLPATKRGDSGFGSTGR